MLKITAIDDEHQRRLVLEGRLVDPWVAELERSWAELRGGNVPRVVVDLKDVLVISETGENLLYRMMGEGATLSCCHGVLNKQVIKRLHHRHERQAGKAQDEA